ncbi:MAG: MFS transporter, partial [Maribacter dokdonensis]
LTSAGIVALVGVLVWLFMKLPADQEKEIVIDRITASQVKEVLRLPSVQLLMVIILCAYVGYKITDVFSLYAKDVMMLNEVASAEVGTVLLFARPVVGVLIGIVADRSRPSLFLFLGFVIAFIGSLIFASGVVENVSYVMFIFSIMIVALGVYAIRSLYFAVMQSGRIPLVLTGTAVGIISLIGYTPDIFAGPAMGYLLDASPGLKGHQHVFWMLAVFSFAGGLAAFRYLQLYGKRFYGNS